MSAIGELLGHKPFYWAEATRESAERQLQQSGPQYFLLRPSSQAHHVTLSYRREANVSGAPVLHSLIRLEYTPAVCFVLVDSNERYATIEALLQCFSLRPLNRPDAMLPPAPVPVPVHVPNVVVPVTPPDSPRTVVVAAAPTGSQKRAATPNQYISLPTKPPVTLRREPPAAAAAAAPPASALAVPLVGDSPCVSPRFIPDPTPPILRLSSRMDAEELLLLGGGSPSSPLPAPPSDELEQMLHIVAEAGDGSAAAARRLLEGTTTTNATADARRSARDVQLLQSLVAVDKLSSGSSAPGEDVFVDENDNGDDAFAGMFDDLGDDVFGDATYVSYVPLPERDAAPTASLERVPTGAALEAALTRNDAALRRESTLSRQSSVALTLQQRRDVTNDDLRARFPTATSVRVTIHGVQGDEGVTIELPANVPMVALLPNIVAALTKEAAERPRGALAAHSGKLSSGFAVQVVHSRPPMDRQASLASVASSSELGTHRALRPALPSSVIRWLNVHLSLNMQNVAADSTLIIWSHQDVRAPLSALPLAVLEGWLSVALVQSEVVSRVHEPRAAAEPPRRLYAALTNDFLFLFDGDTLDTPSVRVVNLQLYDVHFRAGAPLPLVLRHLTLGAGAERVALDVALQLSDAANAGSERGTNVVSDLAAWARALAAYCGDAARRILLGVTPEHDYLARVFEQESGGRVHVPPCVYRVGAAPAVVQQCVSHIVQHLTPSSLGALFSDSSRDADVAQRIDDLAHGLPMPPFGDAEPTFVAARVLLRYLRLLPRPLVPAALHDELVRAQTDADDVRAARACRAVIRSLSVVPRLLLAYLLRFLAHVASFVAAASPNGPQLHEAYIDVLARLFAGFLVEPFDNLSRSSRLVGSGSEATAAPCLAFMVRHWRTICSNLSLEVAETVPCTCPDEMPRSRAPTSSPASRRAAVSVAGSSSESRRGTSSIGGAPWASARSSTFSQNAAAGGSGAAAGANSAGGAASVHPFVGAARMHGWLLKKKKKARSPLFAPQRRYFAACGDALYFFSQPSAPEPLGQLALLGSDVMRLATANVIGGDRSAAQRQFELTADGATYVLTAPSAAECDAWVKTLQALMYDSVRQSRVGSDAPSVEQLLALADNARCADCRAPLLASTAQALVGVGLFVCVPCAAAHRAVGAVQCRKALDPGWTDAQRVAMAARGNQRGALLWEATLLSRIDRGDNVRPAGAAASHAERMEFVKAKYVDKMFFNAAQLTEDDLRAPPAGATSAQAELEQQTEVMARRKLARLSMRVAAQGKGLLNYDLLWAAALPLRAPTTVSMALVAVLGAQLDRFVGIDRTLLDAVRKSAKMRDQFADHASLRAAQEFLAWSERTAELQRVALTSGGAAGFAFGGMLLSEAEQRCFWLNVYSCIVSHVCVALFGGVRPTTADWNRALALRVYGVGDVELSANDVLHGILRGGRPVDAASGTTAAAAAAAAAIEGAARSAFALPLDARVHFAAPTWASDTPPLLAAVSAETLDAALASATRAYLNEHVHFAFRRNEVSLPCVFDVYKNDFGSGSLDDVLDFVQQHVSREKATLLNFMRQHSCSVIMRTEAGGSSTPRVVQ